MNSDRLADGYCLNWYDGLKVVFSADKRFVLIGECWSVRKDESPEAYLANTPDLSVEKILERENYWCGKYLLIAESRIYMDAVGSISVYYHDAFISNSLNLLRELLGYRMKKETLFDGLSPDFVPGTMTSYPGIKRMVPSLVYDYSGKRISTRKLLPMFPLTFESEEERIRAFCDAFAEGLRNLDRHFDGKTKLIACTGGHDSRTAVAVSEYAGTRFDLFTLEHDEIAPADIEIPRRLSEAIGRKHYYIKKDKSRFSSKRLRDYDRHMCHYEKGADRKFYGYAQFEKLKEEVGGDIVLLRGSVWEILIDYYGKFLTKCTFENLLDVFPLMRYNRFYQESVKDWLDKVSRDDLNQEISDPNRLFWDLREGCWLSCIEHAFDLYDGIDSVQPINCRYLMTMLLGFEKEDRVDKIHQEKITRFACPPFSEIPYDYEIEQSAGKNVIKTYGMYLKKAAWLLIHFGPGGLMLFLKQKKERD